MKFLAVLFLAGLALASAIPVPEKAVEEYDFALEDLDLAFEADESLEDLKNRLKERFQ
ncbi:hypothetical protein AVEN_179890-1, partial [Araneus ventricosus]